MIHDLKPYSAYKDSGVPWLEQVPEHWEVQRLKRFAQVNPSKSEVQAAFAANVDVTFLPMERVGADGRVDPIERRPASAVWNGFTYFRRGDVLVAKITPCFENGKGACLDNLPTALGFGSTEFVVLRPKPDLISQFLYRATILPEFRCLGADAMTGATGQQRVPPDFISNFQVALPPLAEQFAIVRFLDCADRRIRRYIHAKKKLITLLNEQKQVIIHRAVTRGLEPNVRLKSSGVKWLGDVPEHWEVTQIRSVARIVRGSSPRPAGSPLYFHGTGEPWITVGELTKDSNMHLRSTSTRLTTAGAESSRTIKNGTLLLTNSGATLGVPKISLIQGCINDGVAAFLNLRQKLNKEFLYFYLTTQTAHLRAWVDLGAQPNLNTQIIGGWPVLLPTTEEQTRIVDHIKRETALIVRALDKAAHEISLIQEYRTRLIADVVTGKLDVREAAARLPDKAEELESLNETETLAEEGEQGDGLDAALEEAET